MATRRSFLGIICFALAFLAGGGWRAVAASLRGRGPYAEARFWRRLPPAA